jgi:hypothetical protein
MNVRATIMKTERKSYIRDVPRPCVLDGLEGIFELAATWSHICSAHQPSSRMKHEDANNIHFTNTLTIFGNSSIMPRR